MVGEDRGWMSVKELERVDDAPRAAADPMGPGRR